MDKLWVLGHSIEPLKTSGDYDMVMGLTPPGVPGPPPHLHTRYSEQFVVLEGRMEFMVNGKTVLPEEGQSIDLPPNCLHTFNNSGSTTCRWLNIHCPKGFYSFFKKFGVPHSEKDAAMRSADELLIGEVLATSREFDMHIKT